MKNKYVIFFGAFALWLVGDLWSKHWADVALGDAFHPLLVAVDGADAGKPLSEVLTARTGMEAAELADKVLPYTRKLGKPLSLTAADPAFRAGGPGSESYGLYVFWRGLDSPPRRVDKVEMILVRRWLRWALPEKSAKEVQDIVREHLDKVTFGQWLERRIPKVSADDVAELGQGFIFPVERRPVRPTMDTKVAEGEIYLVEHRRVDVMGTWTDKAGDTGRKAAPWFQFLYAENPGAAFGFMRGVPEGPRQLLFILLTIAAFIVILGIAYKLPAEAWWLYLALGSILAGAAGNFVDRLRYGYVIDFIDMHLGFMHWPTYNIADIAIAVGVGLLLGDMLFNKNSPLVKVEEESAGKDAKKPKGKGKKASGDVGGAAAQQSS